MSEHELRSISNHLGNIENYLKRIATALEIANGHVPEEDQGKESGVATTFYPLHP